MLVNKYEKNKIKIFIRRTSRLFKKIRTKKLRLFSHLILYLSVNRAKLEIASFLLVTILSSVIQYVVFNCLDRMSAQNSPANCERPREKRPIKSYWLYGREDSLLDSTINMLKLELKEIISRDAISWPTILYSLEINNLLDFPGFNKNTNKNS